MRTKEKILEELKEIGVRKDVGAANLFIVEALLDIRDVLAKEEHCSGSSPVQMYNVDNARNSSNNGPI